VLTLSIRKLILNTENPIAQARKWGPMYAFLVGWIVSLVTITKGLKHVNIHLSDMEGQILSIAVGVVAGDRCQGHDEPHQARRQGRP
jgi:PiT family inorganic phosphate transporter